MKMNAKLTKICHICYIDKEESFIKKNLEYIITC